ncbi:MAG: MmgE/PrpD family protein [Betaproteobacteria bacterium]|nr:MmgE/PrpD family protein [Betaproteobacteria bacterium]
MGAKTTREIAEFVCKTGYKDLPSEVVNYSKILALSHLGVNIAGSAMDFGRKVTLYVKGKGGHPEVGVFGAGFRTCVDYAALANGNSAHATELEDDSFPEAMYSCGHWPTVFAMGEKLKLSGRDVIEALVIGYEVAAKLGLAFLTAVGKGRASYAALSAIGNAAAAAKMLRLNVKQTTSALSIAASQATGLRRQGGTGAHLVEAGFTGRNGICAAELAALGYTGSPTILEGKDGFGDMWSDCPEFDLPLGDGYRLMRVGIKKYSSCYGTQRNIDGVLDLIAEHNIAWDDVASIEHGINYTASHSLKYDQPETAEETRFSFAHCSVACFFDKKVFLPSFTTDKARNPRWREARKKVKVTVHPEWPDGYFDCFDSPVTITTKDGKSYTKLCHSARGDPDQRFGTDDVMKKYLDCMDFAGTFSHARVTQIAEMTLGLDKVEDVSALTTFLTFPDQV